MKNEINRRRVGTLYEERAAKQLSAAGLIEIERNFHCRYGEIDLIMQEGSCLVFIEVRYRKSNRFGDPLQTVTRSKQERIIHSALTWLEKQGLPCESTEFRFDIIAFSPHASEWIKNAFH